MTSFGMLQAHAPHPPCSSGPPAVIGVHRLSVPTGGDRARSALVPPLRTVLSRCEELLDERGVQVDHVTIYRWVRRFTPLLAEAARCAQHGIGTRWQVDETSSRSPAVGGMSTGPWMSMAR